MPCILIRYNRFQLRISTIEMLPLRQKHAPPCFISLMTTCSLVKVILFWGVHSANIGTISCISHGIPTYSFEIGLWWCIMFISNFLLQNLWVGWLELELEVILHACPELCVRFWDCPLVRYDNANKIPRMMIRHHPSLTGYNIPHATCW